MKVNLIETEVTKITKILYISMAVFLIGILTSVYLWNYDKGKNYYALVGIILFLMAFFFRLFRSFIMKDFKIIGEISFTKDSIITSTDSELQTYNVTEIKNLTVDYFGYETESYPNKPGTLGSFSQKQGNKNYVTIDNENKYEFHIKSIKIRNAFFNFLKYYEEVGLDLNFKNYFGSNSIYKK